MEKTNKTYWNNFSQRYKLQNVDKEYFLFDRITEHLKPDNTKSVLEIGCIPGNFLIAFHNLLGFHITGIDYGCMDIARENMYFNNISEYKLISKDFFDYNTFNKFDVVASFGFIEHFDSPGDVIDKMTEHMNKNGYLIIGLPNRRYLNYVFHALTYGKEVLGSHNLKIMDIDRLRSAVPNKISEVYAGYYNGFKYKQYRNHGLKRVIGLSLKTAARLFDKLSSRLNFRISFTHKIFSPYIIYIGQVKGNC